MELLRLLLSCPDVPGVMSTVAGFLHRLSGNIVRSDQHTSAPGSGTFYQRVEFTLPVGGVARLTARFGPEVAEPFGMTWQLSEARRRKRVGILASKADHCLVDLLWRMRRGELDIEVPFVGANHPDLRPAVEPFGVEFHHVPAPKGQRDESEERLVELIAERCDVVVLARYMQILSGAFLAKISMPVINIHHSFLPAFAGAQPYAQAYRRGVKLIGATAHYVTEELDGGPIIEQDVVRASHADDPATLSRLGADVERIVLARAVRWHCEDRLLCYGNRVLVF
jgi:formyltetrahydrofolate deformylase